MESVLGFRLRYVAYMANEKELPQEAQYKCAENKCTEKWCTEGGFIKDEYCSWVQYKSGTVQEGTVDVKRVLLMI